MISRILRETLNEYEIFDIKDRRDSVNKTVMEFNANNLNYIVYLMQTAHRYDGDFIWELAFGVKDESNAIDFYNRTKKNLEHSNSVVYTVFHHMESVVKENKIKYVCFAGTKDSGDVGNTIQGNLRNRLYMRFLTKKYPKEAITTKGEFIIINVGKIYPELFEGEVNQVQENYITLERHIKTIKDGYDLTIILDEIAGDGFDIAFTMETENGGTIKFIIRYIVRGNAFEIVCNDGNVSKRQISNKVEHVIEILEYIVPQIFINNTL